MNDWLKILDWHAQFFQLDEQNMKVSFEDEKEMMITYEAEYRGKQKLWIEKENSKKIKEELKPLDIDHAILIRYLSPFDEEISYVLWVKTPRYTLQMHYYDTEDIEFMDADYIKLDAHIKGYYAKSYRQIPKEQQEEIKKMIFHYSKYVEKKHKRDIRYEEDLHYFLFDTPQEERYLMDDMTLEEIQKWAREDYKEYREEANYSPSTTVYTLADEWNKVFRNQLYKYVVLYEWMELVQKEEMEEKTKKELNYRFHDSIQEVKNELNEKQIKELKNKKLWRES